jgi:outer membrane protein assembly factor BamB
MEVRMRKTLMTLTLLVMIPALCGSADGSTENWPQWRGPNQNGIVESTGLPLNWSASDHVIWKTPLPSWSAATPIIWGDRVFVTSPSAAEATAAPAEAQAASSSQRRRRRASRNPGGPELYLFCISKPDGKVLWKRELDNKNQIHRKQNDASPSPVTDGTHVWVVTGTGVVAAFDMEGTQVWKKDLQKDYGAFGLNWGYASSPLLYGDALIVEVLHGMRTDDPSYIVSLDARSGKVNWRQERPTDAQRESPDAYTTPVLLKHGGKDQIVISGGDYVTGHDPETGAEIWRAAGLNPLNRPNYRVVGTPIINGDIIYAPTRKNPLLALRAGGKGDITESHLLWKYEGSGAPDVPSPICDGTYLYLVDDRGLVTCLDATSGEPVYGPEKTREGIVSASPIIAEGRMYILNEQGVTTVVSTGPEFKVLASNELDGSYTLASPAVSGTRIFIRTESYLYCIGE